MKNHLQKIGVAVVFLVLGAMFFALLAPEEVVGPVLARVGVDRMPIPYHDVNLGLGDYYPVRNKVFWSYNGGKVGGKKFVPSEHQFPAEYQQLVDSVNLVFPNSRFLVSVSSDGEMQLIVDKQEVEGKDGKKYAKRVFSGTFKTGDLEYVVEKIRGGLIKEARKI